MLSDPEIPLKRFFDRPDPEKQFLYKLIMEEPDPAKARFSFAFGGRRFLDNDNCPLFLLRVWKAFSNEIREKQ